MSDVLTQDSIEDRLDEVIEQQLEDGSAPIWQALAAKFPEITTGDDPGHSVELSHAFREQARRWIMINMPKAEERAVKVLREAGFDRVELIHTGGGCMACEVMLPDDVGRILITSADDVFADDQNRYAFGIYDLDVDDDEGSVERVADDAALVDRVHRQIQLEHTTTEIAGTHRTPVYRRRYLGQRAECYTIRHADDDLDGRRIAVRRWLDNGGQGSIGTIEIRALSEAGPDPKLMYADQLNSIARPADVSASLSRAASSFRVEPPDDRYWLTDAVLTTYVRRIEAIAENCADDDLERVESIELRPATADDRYSLITVGEICWNLVVSGWSHGKSYTTIEAIGESGKSHGRQDGDE